MIQAVKSTILVVSNIAVTDSDWIIHPKDSFETIILNTATSRSLVSGSTEISHNFLMSIPNEKKSNLNAAFLLSSIELRHKII